MSQTPLKLTAEWEAQQAILLSWPHQNTDWADNLIDIEKTYLNITKNLLKHQQVYILCPNSLIKTLHSTLKVYCTANELNNVHLFPIEYNDTWVRDYGPISCYQNQQRKFIDFKFNSWGDKYQHSLDNTVNQQLFKLLNLHTNAYSNKQEFILEGGSIETDGLGTLLVTTSCLLNPNRVNKYKQFFPNLYQTATSDKDFVEKILNQYFALKQILWIQHGKLVGDDTDGHIDTLVRFCDKNTICYTACQDPTNPNYSQLQQLAQELQEMRDLNGNAYKLIPLPIPNKILHKGKEILPANYSNFLIANKQVLVPTYADLNDKIALNSLAQCFKDREIIAIDSQALIQQYGSIHCASMQIVA